MHQNAKKILVIEDEMSMLAALNETLNSAGFTVVTAKDGIEGLKIAIDTRPDIILLDILMPKMDGMKMLKELRKNEWGKTVPVIILSNLSPDSNETLFAITETEPAYYFLKTDITLEGVLEKVKEVLKIT